MIALVGINRWVAILVWNQPIARLGDKKPGRNIGFGDPRHGLKYKTQVVIPGNKTFSRRLENGN
jgi:hypothetical protein